jgi:hypothetical protein
VSHSDSVCVRVSQSECFVNVLRVLALLHRSPGPPAPLVREHARLVCVCVCLFGECFVNPCESE